MAGIELTGPGGSMERLALLVEQLDRAADELEQGSPIESRLALILVDNACELMLHQKCGSMVQMDSPAWLHEPKYSRADRQDALGQDFDKKVSFLERHEVLSRDEAAFLKSAHALRNTAYHVGFTDDGISRPVAAVYYELAARLLPRLGKGFISLMEPHELGARFAKHFPESREDLWFLSFKEEDISASLLKRRHEDAATLSGYLSKRLLAELDELRRQLDFLVRDDPRGLTEEEQVRYAQTAMEESRRSAQLPFPHVVGYAEAVQAMRDQIARTFKPKYRRIPFESWRKLASRLASEKNQLRAMEKFSNFRREKGDVSKAIEDASFVLDGWIQQQIDAARGK